MNIQLPAELIAKLQACADGESALAELLQTIERNAVAGSAIEIRGTAATAARNALEVESAQAATEEAAKAVEPKLKKAITAVEAESAALSRIQLRTTLLDKQKTELIEVLRSDVKELQQQLPMWGVDLRASIERDIIAAILPLAAALRRAWVMETASGRGWIAGALNEVRVPRPIRHIDALIDGRRQFFDPGLPLLLDADWQSDPTLVELHRIVSEPFAAVRRLEVAISEANVTPQERSERAARKDRDDEARARDAAAIAAEDRVRAARMAAPATARGYELGGGLDAMKDRAATKAAESAGRRAETSPDVNAGPSLVDEAMNRYAP